MACFGKDIKRLLVALEKVCVKKELPFDGGPSLENDLFHMPVFDMDIVKNKVTVTNFNGQSTVVSLGNVKSVSEDPEKVTVLVSSRSGVDKNLFFVHSRDNKRDYLMNILKESVILNERRKRT